MIEDYVEVKLNPCRKDLTGMKFGKLTVIKPVKTKNSKYSQWLCKCECGNEVVAYSYKLLAGRVKSCGCLMTNIHPYKALKQENAALKAEIETLKKVKDFACINLKNYIADNNKLKAENERLKEESEKSRIEAYKQGQYGNRQFDKYYKLSQTLSKIKEIAEKECKDCLDKRSDSCWICPYYPILDLITKAESEG